MADCNLQNCEIAEFGIRNLEFSQIAAIPCLIVIYKIDIFICFLSRLSSINPMVVGLFDSTILHGGQKSPPPYLTVD